MYKLKHVYATLCFEHNKIKLAVLEKKHDTVNCLYFNEIQHDYLDSNFKITNSHEFRNKLFCLVQNADSFLGVNIKRYILHVSCLPMQTITSTSANFLIFNQTLTQENMDTYLNKYRNHSIDGENLALEVNPVNWTLDDKKYRNFPLGMSGKEIKFEYNALTCANRMVNQFIDLLSSLKLKVIKITNNSLCFGSILATKDKHDKLVIDIKSNNVVVNLYDADGKIRHISTLPYGSRYITQSIKNTFSIPEHESLLPIFDVIKNSSDIDDLPLINIYDEKFLYLKEVTVKHMKLALKNIIANVFTQVERLINNLQSKYTTNFVQANLNVNDDLVSLFQINCPKVIGNGLIISMLKNEIIGLEDYNVNNILSAVQYVDLEQPIEEKTYSIDSFISEEINNQQVKQSIWIKLGLISTKWAAKIGE